MPLPFPRTQEDFLVGFAGRICEEKGWKVLLRAVRSLPDSFKCLIAGDGPQVSELGSLLSHPGLQGRVFYAGLLSRDALWGFYRSLDCLVVPSLTFPKWKEQFGGVLADGMVMGVALVGSDSGAIPEVIGPAGLIVPEGRPDALAAAILRLRENGEMRRQMGKAGQQRFWAEFAIPAYAGKIAKALELRERDEASRKPFI
jgi:glycosyltransferase involved in cell wall biosynthesis